MKKLLLGLGILSLTGMMSVSAQSMEDLLSGDTANKTSEILELPSENDTEINIENIESTEGDTAIDTLSLLGAETLEENGEETAIENIAEEVGSLLGSDLKNSAGTPGNLPTSTELNFSVVNISQENKDAKVVGARPGDMLMYKFTLKSDSEDILNYLPVLDVKSALIALDFSDIGLAELDRNNGTITFPEFTHAAPCEQVFTIYATVKPDCGDLRSVKISASGETANVTLHCELAPTGSFSSKNLLYGGLLIMCLVVFGFGVRRKA